MAIEIPTFSKDTGNGKVDPKTKSTISGQNKTTQKFAQLNEEDECEVVEVQKVSQAINLNVAEECVVANVGGISCTIRLAGEEATPENAVKLMDALRDEIKTGFTGASGGGGNNPPPATP